LALANEFGHFKPLLDFVESVGNPGHAVNQWASEMGTERYNAGNMFKIEFESHGRRRFCRTWRERRILFMLCYEIQNGIEKLKYTVSE
jgi:hypothetical protein